MSETPIKTSCRDCIFAMWEDGNQIDCELDRLHKFDLRGEVKDIDNYCEIQRFCNTCRDSEWLKQKPDIKETIMKDVEVQYAIVVRVRGNIDYENLQYTIGLLQSQTIKPRSINLVQLYSEDTINRSVLQYMTDIPITLTKVVDENKVEETAISLCDTQYYAFVTPGAFINPKTGEELNKLLNYDLEQFLIADISGVMFLHRLFSDVMFKEKNMNISEIIKYIEETNKDMMIKCDLQ